MIVEFSARAVADLAEIGSRSREQFGPAVAAALAARLAETTAMLADMPQSGKTLAERPGVRVIPLVRYPFKVFYRVLEDRVRILHIRHTSRRPWRGE